MRNFPKWLPEVIVVHCDDKLQSGALSEDQKQCIIRLTTHESMRNVWEALNREASKPEQLVDLIEYVRLHPTILFHQAQTHTLTSANQRKVMARISALSELLLATLAQLTSIEPDANKGIALLKSEIYQIQKQAASEQDGTTVVHLHELMDRLEEADAGFGIVETLQSLQEASTLAMDAPAKEPRKQGARTASRTLFIKELKRYIQFNLSKKLNQVVATIVNTAMNLPPETVTEDQVRKA